MKAQTPAPTTMCPKTITGPLSAVCATSLFPLLLLLMLADAVHAQFNYTTNNGTITIWGYTGPGGVVTIPRTINGLPVTSIGYAAFMNCNGLTEVAIPDSVISIGDRAFDFCISLATLSVDPSNPAYSSIDGVLFNRGQTLILRYPEAKNGPYTIPDAVTGMNDYVFSDCIALTSITIPDSVTNIGDYAFNYCSRLTNVTIGHGVIAIGDFAFDSCWNLATITVPNSVIAIGEWALGGLSSLTNITVEALNPAYSSVDGVLFNQNRTTLIQCPSGRAGSYVVPNTVTSIGDSAFANCRLGSVTMGDGVTSIGDNAFDYCFSLTNVALSDGVISIGSMAFDHCSSLTNITIPNSVTSIGSGAFSGTGPIDVTIPGSVTNMDGAFAYCRLRSVKISDGLTTIPDGAFKGCGFLTLTVTVPDSIRSIGYEAFANSGLEVATVGKGVTNIGDRAFYGCPLRAIIFQGNAPSLRSLCCSVFDSNAIVYYSAGTTGWGPTFGGCRTMLWDLQAQFNYTTNNGTITITGYTGPGGLLTIPSTINGLPVTVIGDNAFTYADLAGVTIPNGVIRIGTNAFAQCSLMTITIGDSVTTIGDTAFSGCGRLTSITIPNGVTSIGKWVFINSGLTSIMIGKAVTNLTSQSLEGGDLTGISVDPLNPSYCSIDGVLFDKRQTTLIRCPAGKVGNYTIPDSVSNVGDEAFSACFGLISITIPNSIIAIGEDAFGQCNGLTSITIPHSVASIGGGAFLGCDHLTNASIGNSVTNIGDWAFASCHNLRSLTIPDSVTSIGDSAFDSCGLTTIYFTGNAPRAGNGAMNGTGASVYYLPGTTGWGPTFSGRPTAPWVLSNPVILTTAPSFGVQTNAFGFIISWATNAYVSVEASSNLASPTWLPLQTNALNNGWVYFSDPNWANYPARFYRVRSQ